jgi:UDP-N-acetylglucosamine acyltransferase
METIIEPRVHPTALIDESAELAEGVVVGPYSIVGPNVRIGARTELASHVLIERDTVVGEDCRISHGAVLGTDPQDLKYHGEPTELRVGSRTVIREYVILSNAVNMAGHVSIGDWAIVGGMTPIHQFVRIGAHAFVGGQSRISKDIPPFVRAAGIPLELYGLNSVGLQRRGFSEEVRRELKRAYRLFFASQHNITQALARAREELRALPEVEEFLSFFEGTGRGVSS